MDLTLLEVYAGDWRYLFVWVDGQGTVYQGGQVGSCWHATKITELVVLAALDPSAQIDALENL
jgi:hypothetical protein